MKLVRVLHADDGHALGQWGPALLAVFRRQAVAADFERMADPLREMPEGFVFMSVIDEHAPPGLDAHAREVMGSLLEEVGPHSRAAATAILGGSVRTVVVRTILVGITLAVRTPLPYRVFATIAGAARFVCGHLERPELQPDIEDAAAQLFAAVDAAET